MITGPIGIGKSTMLARVVEKGKSNGLRIGGILSLRIWDRGETIGYNLIDIDSGKMVPLAIIGGRLTEFDVREKDVTYFPLDLFDGRTCRYHFLESAFRRGNELLHDIGERRNEFDVIAVDEIGFLELKGEGFKDAVSLLRDLETFSGLVVVVSRDFLASRVLELFPYRFDKMEINKENTDEMLEEIWEKYFSIHIK